MNKAMQKNLFLPLKKKWYEMIECGIKTEEYRELKPYWIKRLVTADINDPTIDWSKWESYRFSHIKFSYGYTKRTMTFKCKGIRIGKGQSEWGAPDKEVFIIELGEKI